jgi:hypothetical protein
MDRHPSRIFLANSPRSFFHEPGAASKSSTAHANRHRQVVPGSRLPTVLLGRVKNRWSQWNDWGEFECHALGTP